jgi:hypothetical protein
MKFDFNMLVKACDACYIAEGKRRECVDHFGCWVAVKIVWLRDGRRFKSCEVCNAVLHNSTGEICCKCEREANNQLVKAMEKLVSTQNPVRLLNVAFVGSGSVTYKLIFPITKEWCKL